jgi:hypothetical protein
LLGDLTEIYEDSPMRFSTFRSEIKEVPYLSIAINLEVADVNGINEGAIVSQDLANGDTTTLTDVIQLSETIPRKKREVPGLLVVESVETANRIPSSTMFIETEQFTFVHKLADSIDAALKIHPTENKALEVAAAEEVRCLVNTPAIDDMMPTTVELPTPVEVILMDPEPKFVSVLSEHEATTAFMENAESIDALTNTEVRMEGIVELSTVAVPVPPVLSECETVEMSSESAESIEDLIRPELPVSVKATEETYARGCEANEDVVENIEPIEILPKEEVPFPIEEVLEPPTIAVSVPSIENVASFTRPFSLVFCNIDKEIAVANDACAFSVATTSPKASIYGRPKVTKSTIVGNCPIAKNGWYFWDRPTEFRIESNFYYVTNGIAGSSQRVEVLRTLDQFYELRTAVEAMVLSNMDADAVSVGCFESSISFYRSPSACGTFLPPLPLKYRLPYALMTQSMETSLQQKRSALLQIFIEVRNERTCMTCMALQEYNSTF